METHRESQKPTAESISPEPLGTFTRAIVVEVAGDPRRRAVDCAISAALHAALVALLMILPLLFLSELHPYSFTETAMITTVPPPLGQPGSSSPVPRTIPKKILPDVRLYKPVWSPGKNAGPAGPPPSLQTNSSGVGGGIENPLFANLDRAPLLVAPELKPDTETFRLGGDFRVPRVIYGVSLDYPEVAKQLRLMGKVILQGIVDERGNVRQVRRLSGPAVLAKAAADAVLREKFAPATLNGEPTICDLIVVVTFRLF